MGAPYADRPLPPDWQARRQRILARDGYRCTAMTDGVRCEARATDVHHIADRDDHSDGNLTSLCRWHHNRHTSEQGNASRKRTTQRRPEEPHPGMR